MHYHVGEECKWFHLNDRILTTQPTEYKSFYNLLNIIDE